MSISRAKGLQLGPVDSPVSSVTNHELTLNVWHSRSAVGVRNEGYMTLQHTTTHRLQDNYILATIKAVHGRVIFLSSGNDLRGINSRRNEART